MQDITIVVTSCRRHDLLQKTLASLAASDLSGVKEILVIEDSDVTGVDRLVADALGDIPHRFFSNQGNIGQIPSIDKLYAEVTTPYVFHCEDDWVFPGGLQLDAARTVLEASDKIILVLDTDITDLFAGVELEPEQEIAGVRIRLMNHLKSKNWGGFSFHPGLRRMSDYKALGSYGAVGAERELSLHYKFAGYRMAHLSEGTGLHIGAVTTHKPELLSRKFSLTYPFRSLSERLRFAVFKWREKRRG